MADLEKRTWVYAMSPDNYELAPCKCGAIANQWSEFKKHLWCDVCKVDFIPEHNGIFDGPTPVNVASMLGISFDTVDLATGKVEVFANEL